MFVLGGCLRYLVGVGGFNPFEKPVAFPCCQVLGPSISSQTHHRGKSPRPPASPWGGTWRSIIFQGFKTGWWLNPPIWKICSSKLDHFPKFRDENSKKCLSCHQPEKDVMWPVSWFMVTIILGCGSTLEHLTITYMDQLMPNWWFGAGWFGIRIRYPEVTGPLS